jgi:hypothetical protein
MTAVRAEFPVTGTRPDNHEAAKRMAQRANDALESVRAGKRQAAAADPQADRSAANARRAVAEQWSSTGGVAHTPDQ